MGGGEVKVMMEVERGTTLTLRPSRSRSEKRAEIRNSCNTVSYCKSLGLPCVYDAMPRLKSNVEQDVTFDSIRNVDEGNIIIAIVKKPISLGIYKPGIPF